MPILMLLRMQRLTSARKALGGICLQSSCSCGCPHPQQLALAVVTPLLRLVLLLLHPMLSEGGRLLRILGYNSSLMAAAATPAVS